MYEVIRTIAAGHQGVVDLARTADGRLVALKRLAAYDNPDERDVALRRLRREAELLRSIDVDGVVPLLDVIERDGEDGPEVVLVMPYLPGGSLHQRVETAGPLPDRRVGELAIPLLQAVSALHRRGIVHRDIKPSNVLFDAVDGGRPWLVDFGIGTARDLTAGLSATHHLLGTPAFIAPERARGEAATPASDIYSLGATLRFAISGMPPHGIGDLVTIVGRAAAGRIEPLPPTTDPRVTELLDRMCALDPADRPSAAELQPGPEGTSVDRPAAFAAAIAAAPSTSGPPRTALRRSLVAVGALALLAVGIALGLVVADRLGSDHGRDAAADTLVDESATSDETATGQTTPPDDDDVEPQPTTSTTTCVALAYQDCTATAPAPGTDGHRCLDGRYDHDEDPSNGCEAVGDDIDETEFRRGTIEGTIIPVGDGDKILVPVTDRWQFLCDARLTLALTAPEGLDLEMRIWNDGREIANLEVRGGETGSVRLAEPSCANNDSTTLEVIIRATAGRSSEPWILERSGSW